MSAESALSLGNAALSLLRYTSDYGPDGPTMAQATARLEHLSGTKLEMLGAMAYLSLQANTYRRMSNLDAVLAMSQITHIADEFRKTGGI